MDNSLELDESKDEAARALFDASQVTLHALTNSMSQAAVRRRLLTHIAGADTPKNESPSLLHILAVAQQAQEDDAPLPRVPHTPPLRIHRLRDVVDSGPIVAYIRKPHR